MYYLVSLWVSKHFKLQYFIPQVLHVYFDKNPQTEQNFLEGNLEGPTAAVRQLGTSGASSSSPYINKSFCSLNINNNDDNKIKTDNYIYIYINISYCFFY